MDMSAGTAGHVLGAVVGDYKSEMPWVRLGLAASLL